MISRFIRRMFGLRFGSDNVSFIDKEYRKIITREIKEKYWPHLRAKGYFLVVKPYVRPEKTAGGIILSDTVRDDDQYHSVVSQVIDIGPLAYTDDKFSGGVSWANIGDWVVIPRVAGSRIVMETKDSRGSVDSIVFRIIREDDITAVVEDPTKWKIRVTGALT